MPVCLSDRRHDSQLAWGEKDKINCYVYVESDKCRWVELNHHERAHCSLQWEMAFIVQALKASEHFSVTAFI